MLFQIICTYFFVNILEYICKKKKKEIKTNLKLYFFEVILREEILNSERSLKTKFKKKNNVQQLLKFGIIFDFICSIIIAWFIN